MEVSGGVPECEKRSKVGLSVSSTSVTGGSVDEEEEGGLLSGERSSGLDPWFSPKVFSGLGLV